jgi:hypothetical protein
MRPGDAVALWSGGAQAGVYALAELTGVPFEDTAPDWMQPTGEQQTSWSVPLRLTRVLEAPLRKTELHGRRPLIHVPNGSDVAFNLCSRTSTHQHDRTLPPMGEIRHRVRWAPTLVAGRVKSTGTRSGSPGTRETP